MPRKEKGHFRSGDVQRVKTPVEYFFEYILDLKCTTEGGVIGSGEPQGDNKKGF